MAAHQVGCRAGVTGDSHPHFIVVAVPGEADDSAFSPLAAGSAPWWKEGKQGYNQGDGSGGMGDPVRAEGEGPHGVQGWWLATWPDTLPAPRILGAKIS